MFKQGQRVKVISGAWADAAGTVLGNYEGKVIVQLSLRGVNDPQLFRPSELQDWEENYQEERGGGRYEDGGRYG